MRLGLFFVRIDRRRLLDAAEFRALGFSVSAGSAIVPRSNVTGKTVSRVHWTLMLSLLSLTTTGLARADTATVAVASNFAETARVLASDFEDSTGHEVRIVQGSTGKLHAQIVNGAPFDIFLSADVERAATIPSADNGRFIYAIGRLVVWSRDTTLGDENCLSIIENPGTRRIAIANPALAPYGRAAQQFLETYDLWERVQPNLVYGENVAQALQFAATGNAQLAFISASQLKNDALPRTTCVKAAPVDGDALLAQQAVLLDRAASNEAAREFFEYLRSEQGRATISARYYDLADQS